MIQIRMDLPEKVSSNTIYAGVHWTKRKKLADLYHQYMILYKKEKIINYPVSILYNFYFKGRLLDTTNCTFLVKLIEDGMMAQGILAGDDPKHVASTTITSAKGLKDEVIIEIL